MKITFRCPTNGPVTRLAWSGPATMLLAVVAAVSSLTASSAFANGAGACCFPDGTCTDDGGQTSCTAAGGSYQGDGSSCSSTTCPITGACCLTAEGIDECDQQTEDECNAEGGTYQGDGTSCTTPGICAQSATGACCFAAGCTETDQLTCEILLVGTYQGDGTICKTPGICAPPPSGACCTFIAMIPTCNQLSEDECDKAGGFYQGDGTSCPESGSICANGACCLEMEAGDSCQQLTADECDKAGGAYQGDGTSCGMPGICEPSTGACCTSTGCLQKLEIECDLIGGDYQGDGTSCTTPGICPPTGACCLNEKGLIVCRIKTEDDCAKSGGDYQGDGTSCTESNICAPPTGACCLPDGFCNELTEADCIANGGTYRGDDSTCAQTECPAACCLPDGSCVQVTDSDCTALGGQFAGGGTTCATIVCRQPDRVSDTEKGSLLIFPNVELRWSTTGIAGGGLLLIQDTFIDIANDFPADVRVKLYFVNGDPRVVTPGGFVVEPGWNWLDNVITLTANEPTYWSAATGLPKGVSPFTALDPGSQPGRIDHKNPTERMLRGFIIAFAVNELGQEIRWNHLKGDAVVVNYRDNAAWEYNAYSFRAVNPAIANGEQTGTPGELNLNSLEYALCFDQLLLDFYAVGSSALSGPGALVTVDTDLTLLPVDADLRQETSGPITTKASFDIWNMNEVKFTGLDRCITCWDQTLLSNYGIPNHFFLTNLQTDKGRARIDGLASILCPAPGQDGIAGGGPDNGSSQVSLLGLKMTLAVFDGGASVAHAGGNLHGLGIDGAVIKFDTKTDPPAEAVAGEVKEPKVKRRPNRRQR